MENSKKATAAAVSATIENGTLILTFGNNDDLTLTVSPGNLSAGILHAAILHGLKQKLVDAAAISRNLDTGASATIVDKYDAVFEVYQRITSPDGTWNKIRGDGTANSGILIRALMALYDKPKAEIEAFLSTKTDDQRKALRDNPKVAAKMAELRAAGSDIDSDEILNELN